MAINTAAKCKLYITSAVTPPSTYDLSGYGALSYTEVGEIEDMGSFGDSYSIVNFESLADGRTRKLKGVSDAGDITLTVGFDGADSGQQNLKTALDYTDADNYHFKVALNDQLTSLTGSPAGNPTTFYFSGKVTQLKTEVGSVNNVVKGSVTIAIDTAIVQQDAA